MDMEDFNRTWETEYIISRVKRVTESVEAGRYEQAIDYLETVQSKAQAAIDEIRNQEK